MKPCDQIDISKNSGDCFRAVIASILELHLCEVPHVYRDHPDSRDAWKAFQRWAATVGFSVVEIDTKYTKEGWFLPAEGQQCWLCGPSPRFDGVQHAVVGKWENGQYVMTHDPHPSRAGIPSFEQAGFFIQIEPSIRNN